MEIDVAFRSKQEWDRWTALNREIFDQDRIKSAVAGCQKSGIASFFLGPAAPSDVEVRSLNHRESLLAFGFNSRQRTVLDVIQTEFGSPKHRKLKIHLHEAVTRFAMAIKGRFPFVLASEYLPDAESQRQSFPIPHVDICKSGFPKASFDLIVSQEVLEHVPSMDEAFCDMANSMAEGGTLIATVPFRQNSETSLRKAVLKPNNTIEFLVEPEYHGNPVDPAGGSLVFEVPGWDIVERIKAAGFKDAYLRFIGSSSRGLIGQAIFGNFVVVAAK